MRVRDCDWPPSLVVEWLSRQLENRGISGSVHTHTLLSLLHSHYCHQHSSSVVLSTSAPAASLDYAALHTTPLSCSVVSAAAQLDSTIATLPYSKTPADHTTLQKGLLELQEELLLGESFHPDADVPLNPSPKKKRVRAVTEVITVERELQHSFKLHQSRLYLAPYSSLTAEKISKLTALQSLLSVSTQKRDDLEELIEELCCRLREATLEDQLPPAASSSPPLNHNSEIVKGSCDSSAFQSEIIPHCLPTSESPDVPPPSGSCSSVEEDPPLCVNRASPPPPLLSRQTSSPSNNVASPVPTSTGLTESQNSFDLLQEHITTSNNCAVEPIGTFSTNNSCHKALIDIYAGANSACDLSSFNNDNVDHFMSNAANENYLHIQSLKEKEEHNSLANNYVKCETNEDDGCFEKKESCEVATSAAIDNCFKSKCNVLEQVKEGMTELGMLDWKPVEPPPTTEMILEQTQAAPAGVQAEFVHTLVNDGSLSMDANNLLQFYKQNSEKRLENDMVNSSFPFWGPVNSSHGGLLDEGLSSTDKLNVSQAGMQHWKQPWVSGLAEPLDGGYIGDISSRESSQDRQDQQDDGVAENANEEPRSDIKRMLFMKAQNTLSPAVGMSNPIGSSFAHPDNLFDKVPYNSDYSSNSKLSEQQNAYNRFLLAFEKNEPLDNAINLSFFEDKPAQHPNPLPDLNFGQSIAQNDHLRSLTSEGSMQTTSPQHENKVGNFIQTLPKFSTEAEKNIWSDVNANKLAKELEKSLLSSNMPNHQNLEEEESSLCKNFQSLGLERLWSNQSLNNETRDNKNVKEVQGAESVFSNEDQPNFSSLGNLWNTFANVGGSAIVPHAVNPTCLQYNTAEDMPSSSFVPTSIQDAVNNSSVNLTGANKLSFMPVPGGTITGPSGIQAVLHHGHHSNFSSVVPRRTSVPDSETLKPQVSRSDSASGENLLTSPRTHFRPITLLDDTTGTSGIVGSQNTSPLNLKYERSNSGSLYLEKDVIDGSPKKYMIYKDPLLDRRPLYMSHETSLVPKFKVVKNEKFCQTDESADDAVDNQESSPNVPTTEEEYDVFSFQTTEIDSNLKKNWNDNEVLTGSIWNNDYKDNKPGYFNSSKADIIQYINNSSANSWIFPGLSGSKPVSEEEVTEKNIVGNSEEHDRILDTPAANAIWSSNPNPEVRNTSENNRASILAMNSSIKALWANSPQEKYKNDAAQKHGSLTSMEDAGVPHLPGWSMVRSKDEEEMCRQIPIEWVKEQSISRCSAEYQEAIVTSTGAGATDNSKCDNEKVFTEFSNMTRNLVKNYPREGVWSSGDDSVTSGEEYREEEEGSHDMRYNVKWSNDDGGTWNGQNRNTVDADLAALLEAQKWERTVNMGEGNQQEDLEELDPGWMLQEGFVWDPQQGGAIPRRPSQMMATDDFDDTESVTSSTNSEVLIVPTEDGSTLALPVEYLETDMYDQLFGVSQVDLPASLPDHVFDPEAMKALRDKNLPPHKRPCSFFLDGRCRRKHCKYSHDLSEITCRFWLIGECFKGYQCQFLHGFHPPPRRRNRSEGDPHMTTDDDEDEEDCEGTAGAVSRRSRRGRPDAAIPARHRHRHSFELNSDTDFPALGSNSDISKDCERISGGSTVSVPSIISSSNNNNSQPAPAAVKKKTKFTPLPANTIQITNSHSSGNNKGRRRRYTHTTLRTVSPINGAAQQPPAVQPPTTQPPSVQASFVHPSTGAVSRTRNTTNTAAARSNKPRRHRKARGSSKDGTATAASNEGDNKQNNRSGANRTECASEY